jgi:flavin reductase (DIM6/NTAB) family NADH-FMN oxidoreductase RutF
MKRDKFEKKVGDRHQWIRLINSLSGAKSATLIGTQDENKQTNVAIFSSVIHLGSFPALFGFITRPVKHAPRHTYQNIMSTGYYTFNHVHADMIGQAHQTSGKYPKNVSEFEATGLEPIYRSDFPAPYVKEARVQLGLEFREALHIASNETVLVVGELTDIHIESGLLQEDGTLNLNQSQTVAIGGLNHYYRLSWVAQHDRVQLSNEEKANA